MFRDRLKTHSRVYHERLENHPRLIGYASGIVPPDEYRTTVARLCAFWTEAAPATQTLPPAFFDLLRRYREALRIDCGEMVVPISASPRKPYDEIGFYYVLLGSSHGARFMLKKLPQAPDLPSKHLQVLAEEAHALWRPFIQEHLEQIEPGREAAVMATATRMFDDLHAQMAA